MKKYFKKFTYLILIGGFAFLALEGKAQIGNSGIETENQTSRKPFNFTHQPILLLKITPTSLFETDNVFQYGAELAPPFGKFSFNFDYGKGRGSKSFNKTIKELQSDKLTTIMRGEIRMYFSDWYPFYALDKKPFGRYYSIEFMQKSIQKSEMYAYGMGAVDLPNYFQFQKTNLVQKNQAIHAKIGKHFKINKYFFIDGFAGLGIGRYELKSDQPEITPAQYFHTGIFTNKKIIEPNTKGRYFSKAAGFRLVLPI
jgi:hypothetical protein